MRSHRMPKIYFFALRLEMFQHIGIFLPHGRLAPSEHWILAQQYRRCSTNPPSGISVVVRQMGQHKGIFWSRRVQIVEMQELLSHDGSALGVACGVSVSQQGHGICPK